MARPKRTCTIEGCGLTHYGRGLCSMHYLRMYNKARHEADKKIIEQKEKDRKKHVMYDIKNKEFRSEKNRTGVSIEALKETARGAKGMNWCIDAIRRLHPDKIDRLVLFLMKKAEIVTKDEMKQIEESKKWLGKIVQKVHGYWTDVMDDPEASDTLKFNVSKEILSRIVPPKQEIELKDEKRDIPTEELVKQSMNLVVMIKDGNAKKEVSFERNPVGRPGEDK